jgi:hypothetical protein
MDMAQTTLKEALARTPKRPDKARPLDKALQDAIACESALRYRRLVSELNRSRDSDIERALQRAWITEESAKNRLSHLGVVGLDLMAAF